MQPGKPLHNAMTPLRRLALWDERLFLMFNQAHRHVRLRRLSRIVSWTGDGYFYVLMALVLPAWYPGMGRLFVLTGLVGFTIELPLYCLLKRAFRRRRPSRVVEGRTPMLEPSDEFSFPSGHTTAAFMVASITSALFPALTVIVFTWASLIGLSRVMLQVHFLSDVVAGMLLGSAIAMLSLWLSGILVSVL